VEAHRGLAGALRPVHLDDPSLGDPADPQSHVEGQRPGGDHPDPVDPGVLAEAHHRALPVRLLDLLKRQVQHPFPFHGRDLLV
jgi:hypothetical protein